MVTKGKRNNAGSEVQTEAEPNEGVKKISGLFLNPEKVEVSKLGTANVIVILLLSISGQIAWAVENTWFNTFVYDEITPDSTPIAWMVALSAITAALTTLYIGSLSDRTDTKLGRRRPYILFGYVIWGIVTAIFPESALVKNTGMAVVLVVLLDCVMTFFGSTANDAAFNAWTTDISDSTNRGRVQGLLNFSALIANIIALGLAGFIIDTYGYFIFFYILGGSVSLMGLIGGLILKDAEYSREEILEARKEKIWKQIVKTLSPEVIRKNKILYLLFTGMAITNIGSNIFFPYLFIYMEYRIGFTKSLISAAGALVIIVTAIVSILFGMISHKFNRKMLLITFVPLSSFFLIILSTVDGLWTFGILYLLLIVVQTMSSIILFAWIQDNYPPGEIGKFQGVRLIFMVAIPMALGAPIGSMVTHAFGTPAVIDGKPGYIPPPHIFLFGGIFILFTLIPLLFIPKEKGYVSRKDVNPAGTG